MKPRVMFDTGALIALERGDQQIRKIHRLATEHGYQVVGITPVIAEWWRRGKREKERAQILRTLVVEPPDVHVARLAGEAIGLVPGGCRRCPGDGRCVDPQRYRVHVGPRRSATAARAVSCRRARTRLT